MNVTVWAWGLTLLGLLALILVDLWIVDRGEPRDFTLRQAGAWVTFYVLLAAGFGAGLYALAGPGYSTQFFAGYLTEYSLSVDNLFIFYVIMARFAVPRANQHKVLLIGILIALLMRGFFIAVGAAALAEFEWLFYVFGGFLIWTAVGLVRQAPDEDEFEENVLVRWVRRVIPSTDDYHGHRMTVDVGGRRLMTPMLIVMIAIGSTDLLFALDSIPAVFGLTKKPYIVFTSNAFALMGLRQLYFLLRGLLDRLVYLSQGLAFILAFIGVKLVLEAMKTTWFSWAPQISTGLSLIVIGVAMVLTTVASLLRVRRRTGAAAATPAGEAPAGAASGVGGGPGTGGPGREQEPEPPGEQPPGGRSGARRHEEPTGTAGGPDVAEEPENGRRPGRPGAAHTAAGPDAAPPGPRAPADGEEAMDGETATGGHDALPEAGGDPAPDSDHIGPVDRSRR